MGVARRSDPRRAAGGVPGGQLVAGRWVEGHLGSGVAVVGLGAGAVGRGAGAVRGPRAHDPVDRAGPGDAGEPDPTATAATRRQGRWTPMMLARNAESLYWIGRYVERADDTAASSTSRCTNCSRTRPSTRTGPVASCCRCSGWRTTRCGRVRRVGAHRAGRLRQGGLRLHRELHSGGSRERPRRTGGHVQRDVGVPQHDLQRTLRRRTRRAQTRPVRVPRVREEPCGDVRRSRRRHAQPRRRLPLPAPRPFGRTRRHDHPDAVVPGGGPVGVADLGDGAAIRGRPRHLSPHLPRCPGCAARRRVHVVGQAVPALGVPRHHARRAVPDGAGQPSQQPCRCPGRGAAAARPGAQQPGVHAAGGAPRRAAGATAHPAADLSRRERGGHRPVLPRHAYVAWADVRASAGEDHFIEESEL